MPSHQHVEIPDDAFPQPPMAGWLPAFSFRHPNGRDELAPPSPLDRPYRLRQQIGSFGDAIFGIEVPLFTRLDCFAYGVGTGALLITAAFYAGFFALA